MWKETRNQKRDKSAPAKAATDKTPKATQEQMMIAKLVDNDNEDTQLRKNVSKIVEVTGVSEEKALLALYDSNDDPRRAIELLLEKQSAGEDNGWETAGRRKNRGGSSVPRSAEQTNTDSKTETGDKNRSDRGGGTNRGRRSKGRPFDQSKSQEESNNKENENVYKDRRSGRGRGRGMGRGRGRGGSAPRHNRHRQPGVKSDGGSIFQSDSADAFQDPVEVWENPKPSVKCWDIEVGTWSNKEAQKHQEKNAKSDADYYQSNWGSENWNEPDLSESRVFQSQNQITVKPEVTSDNSIPTTAEAETFASHEHVSNSIPKTGERIDLGLLFKKMDTGIRNPAMQGSSNYSGLVNMAQGKTDRNEPDSTDGVPGIQQHCQVNYKDSSISSTSVTSRLFGDYEQSQSKSIFQSEQPPNMMKSAFPQLNGSSSLHGQTKESNSFLDSFSGLHSSNSTKPPQPDLLGQLSGLAGVQSQLPNYSQMRMPIGKNSHTSHADSTAMDTFSKGRNENLLSFGSPLPPQLSQQTRQHRKATLPPKMPASAVEMPTNKGSSQEYSQFSLQFGSDDPSSVSDLSKHDYDVNIPRSTPSNIIAQRGGLFLNKDGSQKPNAPGNVDSLFSSSMQTPSSAEHQTDELKSSSSVSNVDHPISVPPGLNMSVSKMPLSTSDATNNVGNNFLSRNLATDDGPGQLQDSGHHGPTSFPHEVSPYYAVSTSNQSPKARPGVNSTGQPSMSPVTQAQAHNQDNLSSSNMETSSSAALSSLTTALGQVSMSQPSNDSSVPMSGTTPLTYTSTVSTTESQVPPGTSSASLNRIPVYSTVHDKPAPGSYDNSASGAGNNNPSQDISPMVLNMQQQSQSIHPAVENSNNQSNSGYKAQTTSSPSAMGGFGSAKMAPVVSNKGNPNVPSGVTTPIQYGIMPGLMHYPPEMQYGYDQLLLAQSRVVNPLVSNFYDVPFHGNTQTADGQDSSIPVAQNIGGHNKFNRNDGSSSTPPTQLAMPGAVSSDLTQHSSTVPMQAIPHKATQSSTHLPGQQPYVGMPAYPNYGNLAAPYYSLGMANAGFQYPATMFAAAMHQAPKHAASSSDSFPQSSTRFNHTSTSMASSSGLSDLSRNNFQKAHPSGLDKQGYHQHTNTPPSFNLQTITAAVAGGTASGNAAPGLSPYGAPPYMALLQPHQQQMHLLQHQHQDLSSGHSVGSQRNLGTTGMVKSNKRGGYGTSSSYWAN